MEWIYFASDKKASLAATLQFVLNDQLLWRSARNSAGAPIANVAKLQVGSTIYVAWRSTKHVYLRCRIANPIRPAAKNLVVDVVTGAGARDLAAAGYPRNDSGGVEVLRLDAVEECFFAVKGSYGGNNTLHRLKDEDRPPETCALIPPDAFHLPVKRRKPKAVVHPKGRSVEAARQLDRFVIDVDAPHRCFDAYVMVDWSSSSKPVVGNDSIWIAFGEWRGKFAAAAPVNVPTRHDAAKKLRSLVAPLVSARKRVLVGMDFAFGYPAGFADALGLKPPGSAWLRLHKYFSQHVTDTAKNAHNRDAFAAACNRAIAPQGPGPFWGCPPSAATRDLTTHRVGVFTFPYAKRLDEWRITDRRAATQTTTQSVWKLDCGVSVGGQTILGLKYLHELAESLHALRWPFDTGWSVPTSNKGLVCFAEVFPSLPVLRHADWSAEYASCRDRTQVQSCVRHAAELDAVGKLRDAFSRPQGLTAVEARDVSTEEGWILFV